jgi:hypothetical protein
MISMHKEKGTLAHGDATPDISPSRRQLLRWVDITVGLANVAVLGLAISLSHGAFQAPVQAPISKSAADDLYQTLGSAEFEAFQRRYAQEKMAQDLAAAEQMKTEAQRLKAQASEVKSAAERSAEAIRLEASYDGVAQRYHRPERFEITLNYPTAVTKEKTEFGFKAIATPTTNHGTVRVYVNLATVNEGLVPAGESIGTVGKYPVGEGIKAF